SGFEDAVDSGDLAVPLRALFFEALSTAAGELVVVSAAVVLAGAPLGFDPAGAVEAAKGGEQRAGVDAKDGVADVLEAEGNAVAVQGLEGAGFEDEHFEGSLNQVLGHGSKLLFSRYSRGVTETPLDC